MPMICKGGGLMEKLIYILICSAEDGRALAYGTIISIVRACQAEGRVKHGVGITLLPQGV